MPTHFPFRFLLLLPCLLLTAVADEPLIKSTDKVDARDLSVEEMERVTSAGPKYDFQFVDERTVLDPSGQKVALPELKKHLKKGKYNKKAFVILWFAEDAKVPSQEKLEPMFAAFQSYGINKFAIRRKTATAGETGKKVLVISGKPNAGSLTAKDPLPAFEGRPPELKPEKLPDRVRYKLASDKAVNAAAAHAQTRLLAENPDGNPLFGDLVLVNPGAWQYFRNETNLGQKNATPLTGHVQMGRKSVALEGRMLRDAGEIAALEQKLRELVRADGGGTVRALKAAEMDQWWTFIALDIEEPVFVLESKGGRYLFVLSFEKERVFVLDELRGLPGS